MSKSRAMVLTAGPDLAGEARLRRIEALRAGGSTYKAIALELGISVDRVNQLLAREERRKRMLVEEPNGAALSARAYNALCDMLCQVRYGREEFDRILPQRAATLTIRDFQEQPNIGVVTIAEIEQWLASYNLRLATNRPRGTFRTDSS